MTEKSNGNSLFFSIASFATLISLCMILYGFVRTGWFVGLGFVFFMTSLLTLISAICAPEDGALM